MPSSRSFPDLERKPGGPDNWVEAAGGLPSYIERIAKHLHYEQGMTISRAIATAVNVVKKMCASGDTNFPGAQQVNAKSRAQACAAVAEWERKKAKGSKDMAACTGCGVIDLAKIRIVKSEQGAKYFGQPIGSIIVEDDGENVQAVMRVGDQISVGSNTGILRGVTTTGVASVEINGQIHRVQVGQVKPKVKRAFKQPSGAPSKPDPVPQTGGSRDMPKGPPGDPKIDAAKLTQAVLQGTSDELLMAYLSNSTVPSSAKFLIRQILSARKKGKKL